MFADVDAWMIYMDVLIIYHRGIIPPFIPIWKIMAIINPSAAPHPVQSAASEKVEGGAAGSAGRVCGMEPTL
jgi:hypothetical protein